MMKQYRFKGSLGMTVATIMVMALCIRLGLWQYHKADAKQHAQYQIDQGLLHAPNQLPTHAAKQEDWQYKRVRFTGTYLPQYQILLDNRVHNGKAGYHVLTPVKIDDSESVVLVNRGWVNGGANRVLPDIATPSGQQQFVGDLFFPLEKVFSLEAESKSTINWEPLWQHLDMQRYQSAVPFEVKPFIVRMDAQTEAGGFIREWPIPKTRINVHLGYAYQWFGFALTFFVIYLVLNIQRVTKEA
jgi:surfeit locus 1 family protein